MYVYMSGNVKVCFCMSVYMCVYNSKYVFVRMCVSECVCMYICKGAFFLCVYMCV